jgi:hypothetical protein
MSTDTFSIQVTITKFGPDLPEGLSYRLAGTSKWNDLYHKLTDVPQDGNWYCVDVPTKDDAEKASSAVRTWANRNLSYKFNIKPDAVGKGNGGKPCIFVRAVEKPQK